MDKPYHTILYEDLALNNGPLASASLTDLYTVGRGMSIVPVTT